MVQKCVVLGCRSEWYPGCKINFHTFPKDITRRKVWLSIVPLKSEFNDEAEICGLHFKQADYDCTGQHLKQTAHPFIVKNSSFLTGQSMDTNESSLTVDSIPIPSTSSTETSISVERKLSTIVNSTILVKMLNCKRMRLEEANTKHDIFLPLTSCEKRQSDDITVKKEKVECDEQNICRVCLKEGSVPIYGNSGLNNICDALNTFGGIRVSRDDGYPKYLCHSCTTFLQDAILFRKTAQESEKVLRQRSQNTSVSEDSMPLKNEFIKLKDELICNTDDIPLNYQVEVVYDNKKDNKRRYHCKKCNLNFQTQTEYNNHRSSKEHKKMRRTCKICNKTYASVYFKKHLALHKSETRYICDVCGKGFSILPQLTKHKLTHSNKLPFKCSLCPYRGRVGESLKLHMRSHTGDKPYNCPQCSQCLASKSGLNRHMIRKHKSDHEFKCDQCPREFHAKSNLDMHIKVTHNGVKDHVCNVCGRAFGYRNQMMKHQLKVHKREKVKKGGNSLYLIVDKKQDGQES